MPITVLEQLINEITIFTTLKIKDIERMFQEELNNGYTEEEAAKNVRQRVDFMII